MSNNMVLSDTLQTEFVYNGKNMSGRINVYDYLNEKMYPFLCSLIMTEENCKKDNYEYFNSNCEEITNCKIHINNYEKKYYDLRLFVNTVKYRTGGKDYLTTTYLIIRYPKNIISVKVNLDKLTDFYFSPQGYGAKKKGYTGRKNLKPPHKLKDRFELRSFKVVDDEFMQQKKEYLRKNYVFGHRFVECPTDTAKNVIEDKYNFYAYLIIDDDGLCHSQTIDIEYYAVPKK